MNSISRKFKIIDVLLLAMAILPLVVAMVLKIFFTPPTDGVEVSGAIIYFTIPMPLQDFPITESQVNSTFVLITVLFVCLYLTHGIRANVPTKRALIAEWAVESLDKLVEENMGDYFTAFPPFIGAIMAISAFSSLLSLLGLFAPTSDINIVAGWAVLVFFLITYFKLKAGPIVYIKSFGEPVKLLAPINIISEFATPVSMAFRHYGNILSGSVIAVLLATAFTGLSNMVLGWLPGFLGDIPLLRVGIPAILSLYFDVFSGLLQAFIFAMLTMMYVSGGFPADEFEKRKIKKAQKKLQEQNAKA